MVKVGLMVGKVGKGSLLILHTISSADAYRSFLEGGSSNNCIWAPTPNLGLWNTHGIQGLCFLQSCVYASLWVLPHGRLSCFVSLARDCDAMDSAKGRKRVCDPCCFFSSFFGSCFRRLLPALGCCIWWPCVHVVTRLPPERGTAVQG